MITKRGKRVRAIVIVIAIWVIWQVAVNLWWTGTGFCWGSMTECVVF